jgi:hypothetical protein
MLLVKVIIQQKVLKVKEQDLVVQNQFGLNEVKLL